MCYCPCCSRRPASSTVPDFTRTVIAAWAGGILHDARPLPWGVTIWKQVFLSRSSPHGGIQATIPCCRTSDCYRLRPWTSLLLEIAPCVYPLSAVGKVFCSLSTPAWATLLAWLQDLLTTSVGLDYLGLSVPSMDEGVSRTKFTWRIRKFACLEEGCCTVPRYRVSWRVQGTASETRLLQ